MIKVGDIVRIWMGQRDNLAVVLELRRFELNGKMSEQIARVFWPKTQKDGWVKTAYMNVVSQCK